MRRIKIAKILRNESDFLAKYFLSNPSEIPNFNNIYGLVCVCLQTYNTRIYGVESRKLESISLAIEVLVQEVGPPDFIACDKEGSFQQFAKILDKEGIEKLEAKHQIQFKFVVPNAHFTTGLVERRMRMIHDFLGKLDMQGTGLAVSEMMLMFQYVACRINTIPYGIKNIHTYSEEKIQNLREGNELIMFICPVDWMLFQALRLPEDKTLRVLLIRLIL